MLFSIRSRAGGSPSRRNFIKTSASAAACTVVILLLLFGISGSGVATTESERAPIEGSASLRPLPETGPSVPLVSDDFVPLEDDLAPLISDDFISDDFADFVEPDFPFITTAVDADTLAPFVPAGNFAVRAVVVRLGDSTYYAFDPDLLRMSMAWSGEFLSLSTMAMVSYHELRKDNGNPRVLGSPIAGTGMYPGWSTHPPAFVDPREPGPDPEDPGKGPVSESHGRYLGHYVDGNAVIFTYEVGGARVFEQPGQVDAPGGPIVERTFTLSGAGQPLFLTAAEVPNATVASVDSSQIIFAHAEGDSVTIVRLDGDSATAALAVVEGRFAVSRIEPQDTQRLRVAIWTGPRSEADRAEAALARVPVQIREEFLKGGPARWNQTVRTTLEAAPDTAAFVYDDVKLPIPNPWRRNVRPADIAFFEDGRAAVVTFEGDVWIVGGLETASAEWRRFASGLYEPLSLAIHDAGLYVHGREGLVRLHDLNEDGEADFYEAFSPGIIQSTLSREWPFSVVARPEGGFFVSVGGALHAGPTRGREPLAPGFMAGSVHNGAVLSVSPDGRDVDVYASGFRGAYIGIHPGTGALTASDQQGNFVPSTPIYPVEKGGYYGVPPTAHRPAPLPEPVPPITWIPHRIDPSATSQIWALTDRLGPLSGQMINLSYGRPGMLRVYVDSASTPLQGAVAPIPYPSTHPLMNAAIHPIDGLLYTVGFQVWGASAQRVGGMLRMRYTGRQHGLPEAILAGRQGVLLRFDEPVRPPARSDFDVRRWNYRRTEAYGSGHYALDGAEGEERFDVAGVHRSADGRNVVLVLPDMRRVMQMAVTFRLETEDGDSLSDSVYLTVNSIRDLDLERFGLGSAPWVADLEHAQPPVAIGPETEGEPTAEKGQHLYVELGCAACHSIDGSLAGKMGPTFQHLYGSDRPLESGERVTADEDYLREAIIEPAAAVVEGFDAEMPPFGGILAPDDVQSLVLFIKSLTESP